MKPQSAKSKGSRLERKVASVIGGRRAPLSGAIGGSDVWHDRFSVECKARKNLPALIVGAFAQAEGDLAVGDQRVPMVVLQADRGRPVACLYLEDLQAIIDESATQNAWSVRNVFRDIIKLAKTGEELAR